MNRTNCCIKSIVFFYDSANVNTLRAVWVNNLMNCKRIPINDKVICNI